MKPPKTYEMEMRADQLTNLAWVRLGELMENELANSDPEPESISEAELMLMFKRAVAEKSDFLLIRLRYDKAVFTSTLGTK